MRIYIKTLFILALFIAPAEAKFGGGYVGGGLGTAAAKFKYKRPPIKLYDNGIYTGMDTAKIVDEPITWEIVNASVLAGYGSRLNESNYYLGGEFRARIKLLRSGMFISDTSVLAKFGYLPTNDILIYAGVGLGYTYATTLYGGDNGNYIHLPLATGIDINLWGFMRVGPVINWDIALNDFNEFKYYFSAGIKLDLVYEF